MRALERAWIGALLFAGCQQAEHRPAVGVGIATAERWREFRTLSAQTSEPVYHLLDGYDRVWSARVREGVEAAREFYGGFGPVHVFVLGEEEEHPITSAAKERFLEDYEEYCVSSRDRANESFDEHRKEEATRWFDVIAAGDSEAYLSYRNWSEPPMAELVFLNIHQWHRDEDPVSDPMVRGIHEYTHVFQSSIGALPTWMMEGGAVFSEAWIPERLGLRSAREVLERSLESARHSLDAGYGLEQMELIEEATEDVKEHYRGLAYDAGAWATVFLIGCSKERSVKALRDEFYPTARLRGWEAALCAFAGMSSTAEFYVEFEQFMALPSGGQFELLEQLEE